MAFQIAYCAGHYMGTAGKRVPKYLDPDQTREWWLNDRVADYFARAALEYEGVEIMRTDDPTGKTHISIKNRTKKAHDWGADLYLDIHHNAGIGGGSGGGVVAFSKKKDATGKRYRDAIYAAVIAAGGLKGNRANPLVEKNYDTMVKSKAPAVLIECGFMDSRTDHPVIATEAYAQKVGYGVMEGIAKVAGLKKKTDQKENKEGYCTVEIKVLKKGAKGDTVRAMQHLLIGYGFPCGEKGADGSFGGATDRALRAYQKAEKLEVDGSCGPATWARLLGV